ncbi:MAG: gamma-glutamyl-gamma-aminobutyrate hydrolase family protein, partial [Acidimicrobiales bacterium]|nr:gamma-glutamyl-gamma-aminobutyrate hydrolase family protein [Acidimicrobiales bacterium]
ADEIALARRCVERHVPYLGVCLGAQILAAAFGSSTRERPDEACEFGYYPLDVVPAGAELFDGVEAVYQAHSEGIDLLPADAVLLARTELFEAQAFSIGSTALGVQFHPDARGRDIARWWSDNRHLDGRPHAHDLERQLADAERFEESMSTMSKNLVDKWLVQR